MFLQKVSHPTNKKKERGNIELLLDDTHVDAYLSIVITFCQ